MLFFTALPFFINRISTIAVIICLISNIQLHAQSIINIEPNINEIMRILEQKCNVCHTKDKPKIIFTIDNINGFAEKINKQVFIKKRMPKGKEIKLTEEEWMSLKKWVDIKLQK